MSSSEAVSDGGVIGLAISLPLYLPPKVTETVLKMHMHCEGYAGDVRHRLQKMKGVESAKPDMNASTVTVKGIVDPKDLIAFIYKKTRKRAEIVTPKKQKYQNQNQNDGKDSKKKEKDSENKDERTIGLSYSYDPRGLDYATEIFSDENTDACSIM
nr:hypothetical protein [Tanacetum cinerariifolium]